MIFHSEGFSRLRPGLTGSESLCVGERNLGRQVGSRQKESGEYTGPGLFSPETVGLERPRENKRKTIGLYNWKVGETKKVV